MSPLGTFSIIQWIRISDSWIQMVIWIVTKIYSLGPWAMPCPSKKFRQNPFATFSVIWQTTNRQIDRQTDRSKNISPALMWICILVYHCLHGSAPGYLQSSIIPVSDTASRRRLRSASSGDLVVPTTRRLTMGDRAFAVAGPRAWNKLPDSIHQSSSLDVFKRLLKTHLFSLSFY